MTPRPPAQRKIDVLAKLTEEVDAWVASASATGEAYLIPLSFSWDGARLTFATPVKSRTARNLRRAGSARVALGPGRDVVLLDGPLAFFSIGDVDDAVATVFAAEAGFDPRTLDEEYVYFQLTPHRIQAWREADELAGRDVMVDGRWLVP